MSRIAFTIAALVGLPVICTAQLQFTIYPVPTAPSGYGAAPQRIAAGSRGNLRFTQFNPNYGVDLIGRITPSGVMTQFAARQGFGIAAGSDGNLWFLEAAYQKTGRFNPATLQFTEFDSYQHPYTGMDMIAGPDG